MRVVYGARCVWWDTIDKAGSRPGSTLPVCPHCGSVLFEVDDLATWNAGAQKFEDDGHPGYVAFVEWLQGQCFPTAPDALAAYKKATGIEVTI